MWRALSDHVLIPLRFAAPPAAFTVFRAKWFSNFPAADSPERTISALAPILSSPVQI